MLQPLFLIISLTLFALSGCTNKVGQKNQFKGYQTIDSKRVEAIGSEVVRLRHTKSGADVVLIKNKDQARSFMVGFKTPPYDDTGLFHIFEHAVLEGSRLYPSKSNFFHLANSSVASFINAMTGPVYTLYPFVSRSEKDYFNLLSVYMDAVFFPNVLKDPRIIRREGWRYEVHPETKKMSINGIVLSEMKGAFASPYRSLGFHLGKSLIPQSPYSYSSGGLPAKVATLTFQQIVDAHKKYYHPQNSVIYLYGDVKFKNALKEIDQNFLTHFTKHKDFKSPIIANQKNFTYPTPTVEETYPGQPGPNKDFVARGLVIGNTLTPTEEDAAGVLLQAFVEHESSPLRLKVLDQGLAKSVFLYPLGGTDNAMAFVFEGTEASNKEALNKILKQEFENVATQGMDEKLLNSILNSYEFSYKETNANGSHKGMRLGSIVLDNWIDHRTSLYAQLDFVTRFKKIRLLLSDQNFIKKFFSQHILKNNNKRWIVLKPDAKFSEKFNAGLDQQVAEALQAKPIEEYENEFKKYETWVAAKEAPEILEKVPTLDLKDIIPDEPAIPLTQSKVDNYDLVQYPQNTSGIHYLDLYFDLNGVPEKSLKNLSLFTDFILRTSTKNRDFKELITEIDTWMGGFSFSTQSNQNTKDPKQFKPMLKVTTRFLKDNTDKAVALIKEVLSQHQFTPQKHFENIFNEKKANMVSGVSYRAPGLAYGAAKRSFFPRLSAYRSELGGDVFEHYMLKEDIDLKALTAELRSLGQQIINKGRLRMVSVAGPKADLEGLKKVVQDIYASLPSEKTPDATWSFQKQTAYDGYIIPGEVQYVAATTSYAQEGLEYHGSMDVYSRYLNNNYMLPKLREQNGSYGASSGFSETGLFSLSTYKDPNLAKSYEVFSAIPKFMKEEKITAETIKPAILGALKPYYKDKSIYGQVNAMNYILLTDDSWDNYMKIKKEILNTTPEDFNKITAVLEKIIPKSQKAVAGNKNKVKNEAKFLQNILTIQ